MKILEKYKTPENIWKLDKKELIKIPTIGEKIADNILDINVKNDVEKNIKYMEKNNIDIISIQDKDYPQILKETYDPPISLYIKGNKEILNNKAIGIVGCRECTKYGENAAKYFSYNLAKNKINIVSGLAKGIDSFAHSGAIYADEKTIAVVGSGLDIVYPKENKTLADKIVEYGGCIISEYPIRNKTRKK